MFSYQGMYNISNITAILEAKGISILVRSPVKRSCKNAPRVSGSQRGSATDRVSNHSVHIGHLLDSRRRQNEGIKILLPHAAIQAIDREGKR